MNADGDIQTMRRDDREQCGSNDVARMNRGSGSRGSGREEMHRVCCSLVQHQSGACVPRDAACGRGGKSACVFRFLIGESVADFAGGHHGRAEDTSSIQRVIVVEC